MYRRTISVLTLLFLGSCASLNFQADLLPTPYLTVVTSIPPTGTPTPTPTPTTEEWIYPHTIEGLQEYEFQSGKILIGDKLKETDLFTRFAIRYPSGDLRISGIIQIPKVGHEPFPVIVMNHGFFPRSIYASGDGTDRAAEFLNRHGYLTISSDYRSWGDSDIGPSFFYSGLVIDVLNLIKGIETLDQADPDRIGMWGHSMGGGVTLKILTIDTSVKAAVLYSTVSAEDADILERWGPGCIGDIASGERRYGCNSSDILPLELDPGLIQAYKDAVTDSGILDKVAAIRYLDDVAAPVQLAYGTEDGKFFSGTPPEWSKKAYNAFVESGKPAEIFAYEGQGHSFVGDQWWAFMERSAHFFDKHVK